MQDEGGVMKQVNVLRRRIEISRARLVRVSWSPRVDRKLSLAKKVDHPSSSCAI